MSNTHLPDVYNYKNMSTVYSIYLFFEVYLYRLLAWSCGLFVRKRSASEGVLFLENFPKENSGYQYRSHKWKIEFEKHGIKSEVLTIFPNKSDFESQLNDLPRMFVKTIRRRFYQCLYARKYKVVIVRRELLLFNDYGNLFMEKFLHQIHPNVILDFDDDISAAKREPRICSSLYGKLLCENGNKFNDSLRIYKRFVVGSNYLKQKVLNENKSIKSSDVIVIPTCVDYNNYPAKVYENKTGEFILGWIGGNQNLHYLDMLIEPLNRLVDEYNFKMIVVAGRDYKNAGAKFKIENQQWNLAMEKDIIRSFDIGLMPIEDNAVGRGKCSFKLLQYMGLGGVGVATDVMVNGEIIEDGKNGFLVSRDNGNWDIVIRKILNDIGRLSIYGENARKTVANRYSFSSNYNIFEQFINVKKKMD